MGDSIGLRLVVLTEEEDLETEARREARAAARGDGSRPLGARDEGEYPCSETTAWVQSEPMGLVMVTDDDRKG